MRILKLIHEISEKFPTLIGNIEHKPETFHQEIANFLVVHKFLSQDTDYRDYLTKISALSYFNKDTNEDFTLFGFEASKTITFINNEFVDEPLIDEAGFMLFGHLIKSDEINDFYFDSKSLDTKIYRVKHELNREQNKKYELIAEHFYQFLKLINERKI